MKIHIIGCGTLGSRVAVNLYKSLAIKELYLYDGDVITKEDYPIYKKTDIGCYKIYTLQNYLRYSIMINTIIPNIYDFHDYIIQDIDLTDEDIVIDCRDKKSDDVKSHIKVSFDKNILFIDASQTKNLYDNVISEYSGVNDNHCLNLVGEIIINYIVRKLWLFKKFHFYNLNEIIKGEEINLDGRQM